MKRTPTSLFVVLALSCVSLAVVTGSCSKQPAPAPKPDATRVTVRAVPLNTGKPDSDRFGVLPKKILDWPVNHGAAVGFVPDVACKECHELIYAQYQSMGMARSFYPPDPKKDVEAFGKPYFQKVTGRYYVMYRRGDKLFQARYMMDASGQRYAQHEVEVKWIIGSGNHVRTYLSQSEHGEIYELPLSWYTGTGWEMSPGYAVAGHKRFERMISRDCLFCHNAMPQAPVGSDLAHKSLAFPQTLPHGIGCQRCHGPGARHIQAAVADDSDETAIRERILNPGRLPPRQQNDVCLACHLQPDSSGDFQPRVFRQPIYSHHAGDPLEKTFVHMDHGTPAERGKRIQVNHHGYRVRQSKCFTASKGKLTCITCHDPHRKIPVAEQADHYRKRCMSCHKLEDCKTTDMDVRGNLAQSNCISCHMFKARPSDVVHTTITDHLIRRHPPKTDLTAAKEEPRFASQRVQPDPYFGDRTRKDNTFQVYAGIAQASVGEDAKDLTAWHKAFLASRPHPVVAYVNIGRSFIKARRLAEAQQLLQEAAKLYPDVAEVHASLGDALWRDRRPQEGLAALLEALRLDERNPDTRRSLGDVYSILGQWDKAKSAYQTSLHLRPGSARTWRNFAISLQQLGEPKAGIAAAKRAIALNPDDLASWRLVADLHKQQGRWSAMFATIEQGANHLIDLRLQLAALCLLCENKKLLAPGKGKRLAEDVTRQQPDNPRAWLHLALAEALTNPKATALQVLQRAAKLGADPASCAGIAALHHIGQGNREQAGQALAAFDQALQRPPAEPLRPLLVKRLLELTKRSR